MLNLPTDGMHRPDIEWRGSAIELRQKADRNSIALHGMGQQSLAVWPSVVKLGERLNNM
jgi:hypothetical protein